MNILFALLIYPGLALLLVLAALFRVVAERQRFTGFGQLAFNPQALIGIASMLLIACGLALLPWPLHPAAGWTWIGRLALLWALVEGAFLLPLLPGLRSAAPLVVRAASREAQIGVAGRVIIWLVISLLLVQGDWSLAGVPGRVLLLLAGLLALPAAGGVGPFGAERSLNLTGLEQGLDEPTAGLLRFARTARAVGLLAAVIVAALHSMPTQPLIALVVMLALFAVVLLVLRQVAALPRLTLPRALQWCWWRALPLALVGFVYLSMLGIR